MKPTSKSDAAFVKQAFSSAIYTLLKVAIVSENLSTIQNASRFLGALYQLYVSPPLYIKQPFYLNHLVFHRENDTYHNEAEMHQTIGRLCEQYLALYHGNKALNKLDNFWAKHPQQGCIEAGSRMLTNELTLHKPHSPANLVSTAQQLWENAQVVSDNRIMEFMTCIYQVYNKLEAHHQVTETLTYMCKTFLSLLLKMPLQVMEQSSLKLKAFTLKVKNYFTTIGLWDEKQTDISLTDEVKEALVDKLKAYLPPEDKHVIDNFFPATEYSDFIYQIREAALQNDKAAIMEHKTNLLKTLRTPQGKYLLFLWLQEDPDFFSEEILLSQKTLVQLPNQLLNSPMLHILMIENARYWVIEWIEKNKHILTNDYFLRLISFMFVDENHKGVIPLIFSPLFQKISDENRSTIWQALKESLDPLLFTGLMRFLTSPPLNEAEVSQQNKVFLIQSFGGLILTTNPEQLLAWLLSKKDLLTTANNFEVFKRLLLLYNRCKIKNKFNKKEELERIPVIHILISQQSYDFSWVVDWIEDNKQKLFENHLFMQNLCDYKNLSILVQWKKWEFIKSLLPFLSSTDKNKFLMTLLVKKSTATFDDLPILDSKLSLFREIVLKHNLLYDSSFLLHLFLSTGAEALRFFMNGFIELPQDERFASALCNLESTNGQAPLIYMARHQGAETLIKKLNLVERNDFLQVLGKVYSCKATVPPLESVSTYLLATDLGRQILDEAMAQLQQRKNISLLHALSTQEAGVDYIIHYMDATLLQEPNYFLFMVEKLLFVEPGQTPILYSFMTYPRGLDGIEKLIEHVEATRLLDTLSHLPLGSVSHGSGLARLSTSARGREIIATLMQQIPQEKKYGYWYALSVSKEGATYLCKDVRRAYEEKTALLIPLLLMTTPQLNSPLLSHIIKNNSEDPSFLNWLIADNLDLLRDPDFNIIVCSQEKSCLWFLEKISYMDKALHIEIIQSLCISNNKDNRFKSLCALHFISSHIHHDMVKNFLSAPTVKKELSNNNNFITLLCAEHPVALQNKVKPLLNRLCQTAEGNEIIYLIIKKLLPEKEQSLVFTALNKVFENATSALHHFFIKANEKFLPVMITWLNQQLLQMKKSDMQTAMFFNNLTHPGMSQKSTLLSIFSGNYQTVVLVINFLLSYPHILQNEANSEIFLKVLLIPVDNKEPQPCSVAEKWLSHTNMQAAPFYAIHDPRNGQLALKSFIVQFIIKCLLQNKEILKQHFMVEAICQFLSNKKIPLLYELAAFSDSLPIFTYYLNEFNILNNIAYRNKFITALTTINSVASQSALSQLAPYDAGDFINSFLDKDNALIYEKEVLFTLSNNGKSSVFLGGWLLKNETHLQPEKFISALCDLFFIDDNFSGNGLSALYYLLSSPSIRVWLAQFLHKHCQELSLELFEMVFCISYGESHQQLLIENSPIYQLKEFKEGQQFLDKFLEMHPHLITKESFQKLYHGIKKKMTLVPLYTLMNKNKPTVNSKNDSITHNKNNDAEAIIKNALLHFEEDIATFTKRYSVSEKENIKKLLTQCGLEKELYRMQIIYYLAATYGLIPSHIFVKGVQLCFGDGNKERRFSIKHLLEISSGALDITIVKAFLNKSAIFTDKSDAHASYILYILNKSQNQRATAPTVFATHEYADSILPQEKNKAQTVSTYIKNYFPTQNFRARLYHLLMYSRPEAVLSYAEIKNNSSEANLENILLRQSTEVETHEITRRKREDEDVTTQKNKRLKIN